ncbi:unnamed protein product [Boreogadus saida]
MAGIAENKKRRGFNFPNDELEALVQAVEERKCILFGKFSPNLTSRIKGNKWQEVSDAVSAPEFTSQQRRLRGRCLLSPFISPAGGGAPASGSGQRSRWAVFNCTRRTTIHQEASVFD